MFKGFSKEERKVILGISLISVIRMLGLFLLLPVLAPYAKDMEGSSPLLVGLAVGIYGLTQAIFQIPLGHLSDKYGRKIIIGIGLIVYAIGSFIGAWAKDILLLIIGRTIQGMGAISSTAVALAADLTKEETRTKAFALIGSTIGLAFGISLTVAPLLAGKFGVPFIFLITGLFSLIALLYLIFQIPEPEKHYAHTDVSIKNISSLLRDKRLLILYLSTLLERILLVGIFVVMPIELIDKHSIPKGKHWEIYLPAILISIFIMVPFTIWAEKRKKLKEAIIIGIVVLSLSALPYLFTETLISAVATIVLFLIGFHMLEPVLPSLLSKFSPQHVRGLSTGIYNTSQFIGAFVGSVAGGLALKYGVSLMLITNIAVGVLWLIIVFVFLEDKL